MDFRQIEKLNDFREVEFLPIVFRRPAEQAKKIAHRLRQITILDVSDQARALIALTHLRAVEIEDERNMGEARRGCTERTVKLNVLRRVGKMILATNHIGNSHLDVVD